VRRGVSDSFQAFHNPLPLEKSNCSDERMNRSISLLTALSLMFRRKAREARAFTSLYSDQFVVRNEPTPEAA